MTQATNKTNITTYNRGIASILFLAQLLTSCCRFESVEAQAVAPVPASDTAASVAVPAPQETPEATALPAPQEAG